MITLGARFYRWDGRLYVEDQTISGLHAWALHFPRVVAASVSVIEPPPAGWSDAGEAGIAGPRIELVELPDGYDRATYLKERKAVAATLLEIMHRTTYRLFAIGGWIGDWGVTGAVTARRNGIPHGIWFDRVESQVMLESAGSGLIGRLKGRLKWAVGAWNERRVLRGADLALLHGRTVFDRLAPLTRNPHIVEDIHLGAEDRIAPAELAAKQTAAQSGPLRVVYAGRANPMKGPLDWIDALAGLVAQGVDVQADWLGDGEMLEQMQARAAGAGIADRITFHGFVADRPQVLQALREAHLLLFCHLTDESPRILIEALHAGTPLVGYGDPFAKSLVDENRAGTLVSRGAVTALTAAMAALAQDRDALSERIARAASSARHLTRDQVFAHRSEIIKQNLKQNPMEGSHG
ncbi:glycosyltransferase [Aestuariivita sp.]|uniref:glycosyltransferase n=1 Tax=Aestuariivita sp. TaxID=1872407 RepID=UPI002173680B|nr:glycosyltransferase [Aestuariivita sp.]MCE8009465.1 glycosyltransferase family 4 protein [Aestuariivita sp.]